LTGEHGVGVDKKAYMPQMFTADDLDTMQRVRCAFDASGICNPGKLFPTPRSAARFPVPIARIRSNAPVSLSASDVDVDGHRTRGRCGFTLGRRSAAAWSSRCRLQSHPSVILAPHDVSTLAAMLRWADQEKLAVVPRGPGPSGAGAVPARVDIVPVAVAADDSD
jgi:FAD/FMN-containing dehydrogenase